MNNFDMKSARYVGIIIFLCLTFMLAVVNAYKYIPEYNAKNTKEYPELKMENVQQNEIVSAEEASDDDEYVEEDTVDEQPEEISQNEELETQKEFKIVDVENLSTNDFDEIIAEADNYYDEKQFVKAISEYQKAYKVALDNEDKALCYENISTIYAIMKKYGTALAFAQKSYNMSPNTQREVLLARLYYKTGNHDKALERAKNILNREFELE